MKVSKAIKNLFKIFGLLIILILVAAVAIPYFFKDEIIERVQTDINNTLDAKVSFSDVNLSLISSFPRFSFQLEDLQVTGVNEFEGLTLVAADEVDLSLNLMSVINQDDPIEIHSVHLEKPIVNIKVLSNGKANYDITKPSEAAATEETGEYSFLVQLQEYSISEGQIVFDDRFGKLYLEMKDLNHEGSGDFTQDNFEFVTKTTASSITNSYDGITYLNKVKTAIDATFNADIKNMQFELKENDIRLNAMRLLAEGMIALGWDDTTIDLKFNAPQNEFKNLLSLIPSAYSKDFADVTATGKFKFDGFVKGTYSDAKKTYPAFKIRLDIENGSFQYPDLPLGISNISTQASINSPSSNFDKMAIDVPQFSMKLGDNPFEASLKLRTPISDPDIDTKMNGVINLEELSRAIPMEGVKALNGIIKADLIAHTRMSAIDRQDYENVDMSGTLSIEQMNYQADDVPPVKIKAMRMAFTPRNVNLDRFDAQIGKSDVQAMGKIDNILAYFSPEKTMSGQLEVRSNYFDANEWMPAPEPGAVVTPAVAETNVAVFDRFDFTFDAKVKKLVYDIYELADCQVKGQVTPSKLNIENFQLDIGNSDVKGSGLLSNWFNYVFENEIMGGQLKIASNFLDLNQFMTTETLEGGPIAKNTADEELVPFLVPDRMDINVKANINKLRYTNIDLKQVDGNVRVVDQAVQLKNCKANSLGGRMNVNGGYNTQNPEKPNFNLEYQLERLNFREAFDKLNTFQQIAPIGKFIDGHFNTTLKMSGDLGKDLMPDFNSLSADGFLHTLDGIVKNFKPLEQLADKLNLKELRSMQIKDTKNWFKIKDGKVEVEDFDYKVKDIAMKIGGSHGFNQEMNYKIVSRIPRKLLGKNAVGAAANKGLNFLSKEAQKLGLNIAQGEFINIQVNVTGSITTPKFKIRPLGADGEAVESPVDNVVNQVKDEVNKKKDELVEETKKEVEEVKTKAVEEVKNKGKEMVDSLLVNPTTIKEKPVEAVKEIKDKVGGDVKDKAKKASDALKDIFGKKKKKKKKN